MKLYAINYSYQIGDEHQIHYDTWYVALKDSEAVHKYLHEADYQFRTNGLKFLNANFRSIENIHNGYKVVLVKEEV